MATLSDICKYIGAAVNAEINAEGLTNPNVVVVGWPSGPQSREIWGAGKSLVTIYPQKSSRYATQYRPELEQYIPVGFAPLTACVYSPLLADVTIGATWIITFSGVNVPGLNIWTIVNPTIDGNATLYQTIGTESLADIAAAVALLVTEMGEPGITGTAVGDTVLVTGSTPVWCNVGQPLTAELDGEPFFAIETGRFQRNIMITAWAPVPNALVGRTTGNREQLENAIAMSIGGNDAPWNTTPDGAAFQGLWSSIGDWSDKAEDSYTVFRSDNYLEIQYGLLKVISNSATFAAAPIGVVDVTFTLNNNPPQTQYIGGPVTNDCT